MELRHLRYFVAVVEAGNVTAAASGRLHTAQPSLSRQLRQLEDEVGAPLLVRGARGVTLTAAGEAFLPHARAALDAATAAVEAVRRTLRPVRPSFAVGFLTGHEIGWLPRITGALCAELPRIDFRISSRYSPDLADGLQRGELDAAILRVEPRPGVEYRIVGTEPLLVVLPSDHPLADRPAIAAAELCGETFIGFSDIPGVLRGVVDAYLATQGVVLRPAHRIDNFAMGISLVASTRGVAILPRYVEPLLPWSVVSRPLAGPTPVIDIALGFRRDDRSPLLARLLRELVPAP
ncbi:MAG: LysR family transcriptional regulator [Gluconacetobacter diazotrophicus]|nr:LysR family transcriptional regulator [Gluconacetobacter diazotrophicus]